MNWPIVAWASASALVLAVGVAIPARSSQRVESLPQRGSEELSLLTPIGNFINKTEGNVFVNSGDDLLVYQNTTTSQLVVTFFECFAMDVATGKLSPVPLIKKLGATETAMRCRELNGSWLSMTTGPTEVAPIGGPGPYLAGNVFGMVFPPNSMMIVRNDNPNHHLISYHFTGYLRF